MRVHFMLSGSAVLRTELDAVPPPGAEVTLKTTDYKKGLRPGSIIRVVVGDTEPLAFDLTTEGAPTVYIDVNGYKMISEGPEIED